MALVPPRCAGPAAADAWSLSWNREAAQRVEQAVRENGGQPIDFRVAREGLTFQTAVETASRQSLMFTTSSGRLQPVWAFVLSALLSAAAFYVCASLAEAIAGDHVLRSELIFRPLLVVVLLGLFSWLADYRGSRRRASQWPPWGCPGSPERCGSFGVAACWACCSSGWPCSRFLFGAEVSALSHTSRLAPDRV